MVPGGLTDPTSPRILFMYAHLPHAGLLLLYAGAGVWVARDRFLIPTRPNRVGFVFSAEQLTRIGSCGGPDLHPGLPG